MVNVIATQRGYYGGQIRDEGERFDIPSDVMEDKKRRPSWVRLAAFGGRGDHDGDGLTGGSKQADADLSSKTIPELRDIAEDQGVDLSGLTRKADIIAAIELGPVEEREPFSDAPEPKAIETVAKATGSIEPDWFPPSSPTQVDD